MSDTLFEKTREKFIGRPLKSLYKNHSASRNRFVLFLERDSGYPLRLGDDFNLSLLIMRRPNCAEFPIVSINRYYDEIHVTIRKPEENADAGL